MTGVANPWISALPGQDLGDYQVGGYRGRGGFGLVFEAQHRTTGAVVAVKVLPPTTDPGVLADFENEGELLRLLNSCDGLINFIDGGSQAFPMQLGAGGMTVSIDIRYHVLTLADGDVEELLLDPVARAKLGWVERLGLWRWVVKGVMQMHANGVAHRDLKTANCLLVVRKKNVSRVRLADLGRSKRLVLPSVHTPTDYLRGRGDFRFAPPEMIFWQGGMAGADFIAADYYGLGSLLVEVATGQSMTTLAIGDVRAAMVQGLADHSAGVRRDLSVLDLKYRQVIADIVGQMPREIREDATALLTTLCHPQPLQRSRIPYSGDRLSREALAWVLRRTDIMIRRLEIADREARRRQKVSA